MNHKIKFTTESLLAILNVIPYPTDGDISNVLAAINRDHRLSFRRELSGDTLRAFVHAPGKPFTLWYKARQPESGAFHLLNRNAEVQLDVNPENPPRSIYILQSKARRSISFYAIPLEDRPHDNVLHDIPLLLALGGLDFSHPKIGNVIDEALAGILPGYHLIATFNDVKGTEHLSFRNLAEVRATSPQREKAITLFQQYVNA